MQEHCVLPPTKVRAIEFGIFGELERSIWLVDIGGGHCVEG
jgi:hypothetical protein